METAGLRKVTTNTGGTHHIKINKRKNKKTKAYDAKRKTRKEAKAQTKKAKAIIKEAIAQIYTDIHTHYGKGIKPTTKNTAHHQQGNKAGLTQRSGASCRCMGGQVCRGVKSKKRHCSKGTQQQQADLGIGEGQHWKTCGTQQGRRALAAGKTRPRSNTLKKWMRNGGEGQSLMAVD